jgi:Carboxypeptidase regulatory-like domain
LSVVTGEASEGLQLSADQVTSDEKSIPAANSSHFAGIPKIRGGSETMRMTNFLRVAFAFLFAIWCFVTAAMAQTGTATVSGLITDPSGAVVVKAELELKSVDKGFVTTTTSNNDGIYVLTGI